MMYVANAVRLSSANPMRQFAAPLAGTQHATAWTTSGSRRNVWTAESADPKSGRPDGYRHPEAWLLPSKPGALSARGQIVGTGTLAASGALGRNMLADLAGSGSLSATGSLIVSAVAALVGSGTISGATLVGILNAAADLTGEGTLAADASAIGWMLADLSGEGELAAVSYAIGNMVAHIQPFTELSPQSLADAVWSAIAAENNDPGTMGEKVNDAGSASNPWTEVIEGTFTAAELLRIIAAALAGQLSGAATTTITIKGVDEATDRIVATVDSDGNRIDLTLDGTP